jgi:ABC-type transporter Mla subunit MlaD
MTGTPTNPQDTPAPSADQLVGLLSRQRDLYQQLRSLSEQQGALIANHEAEQLLSLLGQRQGLVEELGDLSIQISPHRAAIAALANDGSKPVAAEVRQLVDEVRELLGSIIEQDEVGRQELQQARDEVGAQLRQAAKAPAALGAYGGSAAKAGPQPARFMDQRG